MGKEEVSAWVFERFKGKYSCLDVGVGEGVWNDLLRDCFFRFDGVEIHYPYVEEFNLANRYSNLFIGDIEDYKYLYYNLVIFGDVIEHMDVEKAQWVLEYARHHSQDQIIAVPWLYEQGEINGNVYETHLQPDLTPEVFAERYPMYESLWDDGRYAYYHLRGAKYDV